MKNTVKKTASGLLVFSITVMAAQNTLAAAFYITEIGTPGSLGTAGAANPTNDFGADSSWTNPAGMTGLEKDEILGGLQIIAPRVKFDSSRATAGGRDGGNAGQATPIPSFFYVNKFSERTRLGFSIVAPMGGGVNYGDDFVGRYSASKAILGAVSISPSIGYKVNDRFSIGGGVSFIHTMFDENIAINADAIVPGTQDAKLKLDNLTDWGYQPFAGLTYQMTDRAMLGVVYRAKMDVDLDGDVNIRNWDLPIPKPRANHAKVKWDNPQWLDVGLKYKLTEKNVLFLNGGWQDWSQFSNNGLAFDGGKMDVDTEIDRNWDDTWYARVGFAHEINQNSAYTLGVSYDSSPVKNRDRTFDLAVDEYYKVSAAYGWKGRHNLDFALGATLMIVGDAKINQTSQGVTAAGEFDTNYILFAGGSVRYLF
ncbi:MAG: outer membrane protein transport protein [Pseudomonadota bacterium]|nr:outer membrane protein transport protein [Pseudomonadota bacterium]